MSPSEFWALDPVEFWWQLEARKPQRRYGDLAESDVEELWEVLQGEN
jgi:hypothetical protein